MKNKKNINIEFLNIEINRLIPRINNLENLIKKNKLNFFNEKIKNIENIKQNLNMIENNLIPNLDYDSLNHFYLSFGEFLNNHINFSLNNIKNNINEEINNYLKKNKIKFDLFKTNHLIKKLNN